MILLRLVLLAFVCMGFYPSAIASNGNHYNNTHEKGWFWYENPPAVVKEKKPKPKLKPPAPLVVKKTKPKEDPWKVKARTDVVKPLQLFFNNPAKNVRNYLVWLNGVSNRAEQMVAAVKHQMDVDPSIFPVTTPNAAFASLKLQRFKAAEEQGIMKKSTKRFGFLVFLQHDCAICDIQLSVLKNLKEKGFDVELITPDGIPPKNALGIRTIPDDGIANKFGVKYVPATYIIDSKAEKHYLIKYGVVPLFSIQDRMIEIMEASGDFHYSARIQPWGSNEIVREARRIRGFNPFKVYEEMQDSAANRRQGE